MPKELMSMTEYAAYRGVSHVAVHKAIKAGRISTIDGKIDPKVADAEWARNTRLRADNRPKRLQVQAQTDTNNEISGEDYWTARARRECAEAAIAELKRAELEGKLIRVEAVRAALAKRIASTRDALLQIPGRLAPVLAAESDMDRVAQLLEDELRTALADISRVDGLGG
ncbi:MAG: hypothetical protein N2690_00850 [Rhodocyclaceae bacterium]|nr:hypothetical protein [Rhodocyclaceae bacterium]